MTQRYQVALGEMRSHSEHTTSGTPVGEFVISFTVEPPVRFISEQAATEMGHHVLVAWNALGKTGYAESGSKEEEFKSSHALVSFSHETSDDDENVTRGVISGYDAAHPEQFDRHALQQAFEIVLNGGESAEQQYFRSLLHSPDSPPEAP